MKMILDLDPQRSGEIFINIRKSGGLKELFDYERKPSLL